MKNFYVTTPIYYVNDKPHVGHAYSTIAADMLQRYHSLRGQPRYFLTGTDEHGQKIERRAAEQQLTPQEFVDRMAPAFRQKADLLHCQYNRFIRTTDRSHKACAQALWKKLEQAGDIYLDEYEGWYSVSSEAFLSEKDLLPGNLDPITKKPVERVREQSYFFRLSKYTEPLLRFYEENPKFIQPESRRNEVIRFVEQGLRDLSISRSSFRWGVAVPGDHRHVMYVWLDALTNYISALGAFDEQSNLFGQFWPPEAEAIHIVGKDILRFHAVYWPAFLMSAQIPCPTQIWAHGWLTVDGEKMSKSAGNFISPAPLVEAFGPDVIRYYLMRDIAFGQDGDFNHRSLVNRYQGELGNGLGNLVHRSISSMLPKGFDGKIPSVDMQDLSETEHQLIEFAQQTAITAAQYYQDVAPHRALETIWTLVNAANKYVDTTAPWALLKKGNKERLGQVLYTTAECIRWLSVMLWPVLPDKCDAIRHQLGLPPLLPTVNADLWPSAWGGLVGGTCTHTGTPIFPRLDEKQEEAMLTRLEPTPATPPQSVKKTAKTKTANQEESTVTFDDFMKIELRLGEVKSAERVEKSDKLLKLSIDIGEPSARQIVAGIGKHYAPEDLIGKKLVIVANLPPRKLMGIESQGMVLAASDDENLSVLGIDKNIQVGKRVS